MLEQTSPLCWLEGRQPTNLVRVIEESLGSGGWSVDAGALARKFRDIAQQFSQDAMRLVAVQPASKGTLRDVCGDYTIIHAWQGHQWITLLVLATVESAAVAATRCKSLHLAVTAQGFRVVVQRDATNLSQEEVLREFARESRAARRFKGKPYIAQAAVFEGELIPRLIVQEYCSLGPATARRILRYKSVDRARFLQQAITALTWVNQAGLVHCDVKDLNLLLQKVGHGVEIRLIDWGHSRKLGWNQSRDIWVGTFPAPELWHADRPPEAHLDRDRAPCWAQKLWYKAYPLDQGQDVFGLGLWVLQTMLRLGPIYRFSFGHGPIWLYDRRDICSDAEWSTVPKAWRFLVGGLLEPNPKKRLGLSQAKSAADTLITTLVSSHK